MTSTPVRRHLHPAGDRSASAVLHGTHALRGNPVTWHITPRSAERGQPQTFLVEWADGDFDDEIAWLLTERQAEVMTAAQVRDLVRRVTGL